MHSFVAPALPKDAAVAQSGLSAAYRQGLEIATLRHLQACWHDRPERTAPDKPTPAYFRVSVLENGRIQHEIMSQGYDPELKALANSAMRAFAACPPLALPSNLPQGWEVHSFVAPALPKDPNPVAPFRGEAEVGVSLTEQHAIAAMRQSCANDTAVYCGNVSSDGVRDCMRANSFRLSPRCKAAASNLARMRNRR